MAEKDKELKEINDLCSPNEKLSNEELEQVMAFNEVFDPRNIENANIAEFTGATGMILAICYKDILIAYAGNSRCLILDAEGKIINQTTDHTIKSANEKKRVDLARSFNDEDEEKKKGEDEHMEYLDSTRGFGDLEFKGNEWIEQKDQEISVEPMFEGDDNKINEEVRKYFFENVSKNSETKFSEIIKNYFEKIIPEDKNKNEKNIGLDNMSCFLIELKKEEIEKFIKIRDEEIKEQKRKEEEEKKRKKEEDMKRRQEERKKREEERKKKEEEKKKKEEEEKNGGKKEEKSEEVKEEKKEEGEKKEENEIIIEKEKKEEKKDENEIIIEQEKKDEIKDEKKEETPKEEKKEENEIIIEQEKKEEKPEEKKEEAKEENKEEIKIEKKEEDNKENEEEKKEEPVEENKEEKKEE